MYIAQEIEAPSSPKLKKQNMQRMVTQSTKSKMSTATRKLYRKQQLKSTTSISVESPFVGGKKEEDNEEIEQDLLDNSAELGKRMKLLEDELETILDISDKIGSAQSSAHSEADIEDIISFLDNYDCLKGNFDLLSRPQIKKCLSCLECRYLDKGEYLFKQGDSADNAYLILFGKMNMVSRDLQNIDRTKTNLEHCYETKIDTADKIYKNESREEREVSLNALFRHKVRRNLVGRDARFD